MMARYAERGGLVGQGIGAEMIADQWGISREDLDAFSARSQQRAARATAEGRFESEIVPVAVRDDEGNDTDELHHHRRGHPPGHARSRRWPTSSRPSSPRTARSPPATRRRSPTAPRPCSS